MGHYSSSQSRLVTVFDRLGKAHTMSEREFLATGKEKGLSRTKPAPKKAAVAKPEKQKNEDGK